MVCGDKGLFRVASCWWYKIGGVGVGVLPSKKNVSGMGSAGRNSKQKAPAKSFENIIKAFELHCKYRGRLMMEMGI